jgi:hypothetical protein
MFMSVREPAVTKISEVVVAKLEQLIEVVYFISIPHPYFSDDLCPSREIQALDEVPESKGHAKTLKLKIHAFQ